MAPPQTALELLPLADARDELQVEMLADGTSPFDGRITREIAAAVSWVERESGRSLIGDDAMDPTPPALIHACVAVCRTFYNGGEEITARNIAFALIRPWRRLGR